MNKVDIRYLKLGYVALGVSDLTIGADFYTRVVGLALTEATDDAVYLRCTDQHHDVVLYRADVPGLQRVSWEMESSTALKALQETLLAQGLEPVPLNDQEAKTLKLSEAFRIREPVTGATLEFYVSMDKVPEGQVRTHTKILRLGHVILGSTDAPATEQFLSRINFRVSDRIGQAVVFMRCFPNPYHHSFGVARAATSHFHHLNFMVEDMADIGRANNRMKDNDVPIVFGPGQHPASESVFFYFLDPDELTLEYSFGMEEFAEEAPRDGRELPPEPGSLDRWGGKPAVSFAKTGTIS